jgi:hypothetical protein
MISGQPLNSLVAFRRANSLNPWQTSRLRIAIDRFACAFVWAGSGVIAAIKTKNPPIRGKGIGGPLMRQAMTARRPVILTRNDRERN